MVGKGGILGHIKDEDRDTAFPIEDADWVGAKREGSTLWGKAYIPPGAAREFIRRLKARGGQLATSIYGPYKEKKSLDNGRWQAIGLKLESLDLAPADRAALKLGGGFTVTAQMTTEIDKENDMTRDEVLAELTAKDIPASLREAIISEHTANNKQSQQLAELQQQLSDQRTLNETLQAQVKDNQVKEFATAVDGVVAEYVKLEAKSEQGKERVEALRRMYRARLVSELGDDREKLAEQAKALWESEFQVIAETIRDSLAGPAAIVGQRSNGSKNLEDTAENRARARAITGIGR
jgi:hypothetical protein